MSALVQRAVGKPAMQPHDAATWLRRNGPPLAFEADDVGRRVGLAGSAVLACVLVYTLSIHDHLIVSPFVGTGTMGVLALWTVWYRRLAQRRAARQDIGRGAALEGTLAFNEGAGDPVSR